MSVNERIKDLRNKLHLSQEYVAKYLGINRTSYTQIENGNRRITVDEVIKLSKLYGLSTDSILLEKKENMLNTVFARGFEELDERDQTEIINLIKYKQRNKKR